AELMKNGYTADVGFRGNGIKADNGAIVGNKVLDKNGNECGVCYKDDYGRCYYYLYKDYTPPANNEENTESLTRAQNGNEADEPSTPPEQEVADGTLDTDTAIQVSQLVTGGVAIEDAIDIIEDMDLPLAQQAMAMQKYVSDCIQNNIPIEMNFGKTPTEKLLNKYMDLVDINSSDYNPDAFIGLVGAFACVAGKNLAAGERFSGELNATVVQNLINCISNSDMTKDQIKTLNSYINLVDIVELSFSGNQETVLLNKLFNKIYDESSAQSDKSYFEANNPYVSPLTWATSKTFETIQKGLDKTRDYRHKSTQAARSAIMSTANYNVETLVKNLREMGLFNSSARGAAQRACMQYVFDILLADDDAQMSEFRNKYFADIY
ncbi:hypothetical protein IJ670_06015, partial [bacterium]|nr:hypothetical protein [bacterium]